ncbi:MAG TPA: cupin domain-containing protein [bacterium]|nr:cupin domain-containing protein [bacterium]
MTILRKDEGTVIFRKDGATGIEKTPALVVLKIRPGCGIAPHALPVQAVFYILRGTGVMTLGGEKVTLSAGDLAAAEPGVERAWENPGRHPLEILAIKEPGG